MKNYLRPLRSLALAALMSLTLANCAKSAGKLVVAEKKDDDGAGKPVTKPTDGDVTTETGCDLAALSAVAPTQTGKPEILGLCLDDETGLSVVFTSYKAGSALKLKAGDVALTLAKLNPAAGAGTSSYWQNYINKYEEPSTGEWPYTAKKLQATTENTGTLAKLSDGVYAYRFTNPVTNITSPVAVLWQPSLTHRVGIEFRGGVQDPALGNPVFTWSPETGKTSDLTTTRDMVDTANCNECHSRLAMHGGARTDTQYCVLCHNPGSTDANSGNTVDLRVMVHKIHMGNALPSNEGPDGIFKDDYRTGVNEANDNGEYVLWGYRNGKKDFSTVAFPGDQRNCIKCHDPANAKTPDAVNYLQKPSIQACASCHDNVSFDTGTTSHAGGASTNADCFACHGPNKPYSADVSHMTDFPTPNNPNVPPGIPIVTMLLKDGYMANGTQPVVTMAIYLDGIPMQLNAAPVALSASVWSYGMYGDKHILGLPSLQMAFTVTETTTQLWSSLGANSPNLDFNNWFTNYSSASNKHEGKSATGSRLTNGQPQSFTLANSAGAAGYPRGVTITANLFDNGDGTFTTQPYQLLSVPSNAKNVAIAMQGYLGIDLNGNKVISSDERIGGDSQIVGMGTNDTPRRKVVDIANCQNCHERLSLHGGNRTNNPNQCVICHNGNATDRNQRPVSPKDGLTEQPIMFSRMIHRIHRGEGLYGATYVVYGNSKSENDFKEVRFPGKINQCETCHLPGTYQLPLAAGALGMSVNTITYTDQNLGKASPWDDQNVSPTGAACSGCHDSPSALAHTQVDSFYNSILLHGTENDSCAVCHGPGEPFDVKNVHGVK